MYGVLATKLLYTAIYVSSYYNMCPHTGMGVIQWGMECQLKRNDQHRTAETCQTAEILHKTSGIFRTAENCPTTTASNETIIRCICTSGASQQSRFSEKQIFSTIGKSFGGDLISHTDND